MKKILVSTLVVSTLSGYAFAQDMDEDPRKALERAGNAAACIGDLDQNLMQALTRKRQESQREMEKLCAAGKRKEAQAKVKSIYEQEMKDPIAIKMRECFGLLGPSRVTDDTSTNICDSL